MVDIFEDIRDRGQREGRQRGLQEGQHEGHVKALTELLVRRFGSLPRGAKARLRDADEATLSRWTLRVLDATRLEDVFRSPQRRSHAVPLAPPAVSRPLEGGVPFARAPLTCTSTTPHARLDDAPHSPRDTLKSC